MLFVLHVLINTVQKNVQTLNVFLRTERLQKPDS